MKRRIVLLGPPVSGKGTQAGLLKQKFGFVTASPGAMLREELVARTAIGLEADRATSQGKLVSDEIINSVVNEWLSRQEGRGLVFDGYPRTLVQAAALDSMLEKKGTPLELAILLEARTDVLRSRVERRLNCGQCGNIVSIGLHISQGETNCPRCGATMTRRNDDTVETLEARLREYEEKTAPVIGYYEQQTILHRINGESSVDIVFTQISEILITP